MMISCHHNAYNDAQHAAGVTVLRNDFATLWHLQHEAKVAQGHVHALCTRTWPWPSAFDSSNQMICTINAEQSISMSLIALAEQPMASDANHCRCSQGNNMHHDDTATDMSSLVRCMLCNLQGVQGRRMHIRALSCKSFSNN